MVGAGTAPRLGLMRCHQVTVAIGALSKRTLYQEAGTLENGEPSSMLLHALLALEGRRVRFGRLPLETG